MRAYTYGMGRAVLLASLSLSVALGPIHQAAAQEAKPSEAQLYFSNGVELLQQTPPNYQDAYNQFLLAYQKSNQSWKVLGNLGLCALNLERDGEAITYYRKYLDEGGQEIDPQERTSIEKELLLVSGNLASVTFESKAKNVKLTVRREGSSAPSRSYKLADAPIKLGIRAGSYSVSAEGEGKKLVWETVLEPGQDVSHVFDFAEPPPAAATATPEDSGSSTMQTVGIVTGGVGIAALVGGVVTGLIAKGNESSARDQCIEGAAGALTCPNSSQDDFDGAKSLAMVSTVMFIGGGVLTAAGVTLFLVGGNASPSDSAAGTTASVQLVPMATWGGAGLSAIGRF